MKVRIPPFAIVLSTLSLALTAAGQSPQLVLLSNGNVLEGQVDHLGNLYHIDTGTSILRLPASEVKCVVASMHDAYAARRADVREGVAVDRLELAAWCIRQELWAEAADMLAETRQIAPRHPDINFLQRRLDVASRAAMRAAQQRQMALPAAAEATPVVAETEMAELESLAASLPSGALEDFARHVQPILVNGCAAGGCHSTDDERTFRLNRDLVRGTATRESTLRNLHAVWQAVDHEMPDHSPLLLEPSVPHGGLPRPVFGGHRTKAQEKLVEWVRVVTRKSPQVLPQSAETINLAGYQQVGSPAPPAAEPATGLTHFWDDPAAMGLDADAEAPVAPQPVRYGATPKQFKPRDEFDPELFNRRAQSAPEATTQSAPQ